MPQQTTQFRKRGYTFLSRLDEATFKGNVLGVYIADGNVGRGLGGLYGQIASCPYLWRCYFNINHVNNVYVCGFFVSFDGHLCSNENPRGKVNNHEGKLNRV
jgi:hypothetical protein